MSIESAISNEDLVVWQIADIENDQIPEPAILIREYSETIGLNQNGEQILINKDRKNLLQLIRALRQKADVC